MFRVELLPVFLTDLRENGFTIGIREVERVDTLLLHLAAEGAMPPDSERLCNMLASLLSSNGEQSAHFQQRFVRFFGPNQRLRFFDESRRSDEAVEGQSATGVVETNPREARLESRRAAFEAEARRFRRRLLTAVVIALVLLVVLPHALFFSTRSVVVTRSSTPAASGAAPDVPSASTTPAPVSPSPLRSFAPSAWRGTLSSASLLILALLPFAGLAIWAAFPARRGRAYAQHRKIEGKPELVDLVLASAARGPFEFEEMNRMLQPLRRPLLVASHELDVEASLAATIESMGWFTPVYASRPVAPEYLILIDRQGKADHLAKFAESLVVALKDAHVYVTTFYFDADPRRVYAEAGAMRFSFEEICGKLDHHRLILVTNGNWLLDPVSGAIEDWALQITQFERRVCVTPTPIPLWGFRELAISTALSMTVLPLLPASIERMVEILAGEQIAGGGPERSSAEISRELERLADLLEDRPNRWSATSAPDATTLQALMARLQAVLHGDGFRWMAACAVYPELHWNLTLHVLAELRSEERRGTVAWDQLLLLSTLPWFRDGNMPNWLRSALLDELSAHEYRHLHGVFSRLFLSVFAHARKDVRLQMAVDRKQTDRSRARVNELTSGDNVLAQFMTGRPELDRTIFRFSARLSRYLMSGQTYMTRRSAASTLPAREAIANASALETTLDLTEAQLLTVTNAPHPAIGEQAGLRHVVSLRTRFDEDVGLKDDYFLFQPTSAPFAHLLDENTAVHLVQRDRLVMRILLINFLFIVVAAFSFVGNILSRVPDALAIALVCLFLLLPLLLVDLMLMRRLRSCIGKFPAFAPVEGLVHRAKDFKRIRTTASR